MVLHIQFFIPIFCFLLILSFATLGIVIKEAPHNVNEDSSSVAMTVSKKDTTTKTPRKMLKLKTAAGKKGAEDGAVSDTSMVEDLSNGKHLKTKKTSRNIKTNPVVTGTSVGTRSSLSRAVSKQTKQSEDSAQPMEVAYEDFTGIESGNNEQLISFAGDVSEVQSEHDGLPPLLDVDQPWNYDSGVNSIPEFEINSENSKRWRLPGKKALMDTDNKLNEN